MRGDIVLEMCNANVTWEAILWKQYFSEANMQLQPNYLETTCKHRTVVETANLDDFYAETKVLSLIKPGLDICLTETIAGLWANSLSVMTL